MLFHLQNVVVQDFSGMHVLGTSRFLYHPNAWVTKIVKPSTEHTRTVASLSFWWRPEFSVCSRTRLFTVLALVESPTGRPLSPCCCLFPVPGAYWSSVGSFQIPAPLGLVKILYQCPSFSVGVTFNSALLSLPDLDNLQRKVAMEILHSAQPNLASVSY